MELCCDDVIVEPASTPKTEFSEPVELSRPARAPTKVFWVPVLGPAPIPIDRLSVLPTVSTLDPPILNCVVALTMLPESVPPTVPLPLIEKFVEACWVVVF
jgi:hypothetical protein